jgi:hypothetical protein
LSLIAGDQTTWDFADAKPGRRPDGFVFTSSYQTLTQVLQLDTWGRALYPVMKITGLIEAGR